MQISFSKELYSKTALLKAAYAFTDRAYIHLDVSPGDFVVDIEMKPEYDSISEREFVNEMLHQAVRFDIYSKTKTIRELLMARAMASTVIEKPEHGADDSQPDSFDMERILTDWFERNE